MVATVEGGAAGVGGGGTYGKASALVDAVFANADVGGVGSGISGAVRAGVVRASARGPATPLLEIMLVVVAAPGRLGPPKDAGCVALFAGIIKPEPWPPSEDGPAALPQPFPGVGITAPLAGVFGAVVYDDVWLPILYGIASIDVRGRLLESIVLPLAPAPTDRFARLAAFSPPAPFADCPLPAVLLQPCAAWFVVVVGVREAIAPGCGPLWHPDSVTTVASSPARPSRRLLPMGFPSQLVVAARAARARSVTLFRSQFRLR
jgi:hypothetical protein